MKGRPKMAMQAGLDQALAAVRNKALEEAARVVEFHQPGPNVVPETIRSLKRPVYPHGRWIGTGTGGP